MAGSQLLALAGQCSATLGNHADRVRDRASFYGLLTSNASGGLGEDQTMQSNQRAGRSKHPSVPGWLNEPYNGIGIRPEPERLVRVVGNSYCGQRTREIGFV